MKLWLLTPHDPNSGLWLTWYDKAFAFVIRAETEEKARIQAQNLGGDEVPGKFSEEGPSSTLPWCDTSLTTCVELTAEGEEGVIIRDLHSV